MRVFFLSDMAAVYTLTNSRIEWTYTECQRYVYVKLSSKRRGLTLPKETPKNNNKNQEANETRLTCNQTLPPRSIPPNPPMNPSASRSRILVIRTTSHRLIMQRHVYKCLHIHWPMYTLAPCMAVARWH